MLQFEGWKKTLVLFVILLGCVYAVPNLFSSGSDHQTRSGVMSWLPGEAINLGLDLQGGSHLLLQQQVRSCLLYTSPSPRDRTRSRMPSSA